MGEVGAGGAMVGSQMGQGGEVMEGGQRAR